MLPVEKLKINLKNKIRVRQLGPLPTATRRLLLARHRGFPSAAATAGRAQPHPRPEAAMQFTLLFSRQGKLPLQKGYASLYFCCAIEDQDNELITLEIIHRYVELLDKNFGSVCELDIIFNFEKAYFILDEFLLGGEVQETAKKMSLKQLSRPIYCRSHGMNILMSLCTK
uniref:AP complex mu/sigma subunit domain-containing protein n=1 Tax=Oryctolagus cuniculus TaxID=9986 RepID=U3KPQ5_RABIT